VKHTPKQQKHKVKGKGKGHTLNIVPLSEGTLLQKFSGMARVVEEFHSLPAHPTFIHERNEPYLPLPSQPNWFLFTDPGEMEG